MAVGAKIKLGPEYSGWSLIFDFRAEVFPPPADFVLKLDSSYLFETKSFSGGSELKKL